VRTRKRRYPRPPSVLAGHIGPTSCGVHLELVHRRITFAASYRPLGAIHLSSGEMGDMGRVCGSRPSVRPKKRWPIVGPMTRPRSQAADRPLGRMAPDRLLLKSRRALACGAWVGDLWCCPHHSPAAVAEPARREAGLPCSSLRRCPANGCRIRHRRHASSCALPERRSATADTTRAAR
jgi:hypothetical protein